MKEAANAVGAKTARACDSCVRRRARWFCAADDAFLCEACDSLVHSANQLASRHERVRLQTASSRQAWYSGFTRKARTPRHNTKYKEEREATLSLVPEMVTEEAAEDTEELLLCRVPEFDPDELCHMYCDIDREDAVEGLENFPEFLAEFAADVESLLEVGEDQELFGLIDNCKQENNGDDATMVVNKNEIKDEQVVEVENNDNNNTGTGTGTGESSSSSSGIKGKIFLRLNYEEVMSAWDSQAQGCPWTTANPPHHLNSQLDFLCLGWSGDMSNNVGYGHKEIEAVGGGREARVSRYREKRRTRLFAKKIRYQVRKLNAEKRPRMKGRFVKRPSFLPTPTAAP